MINPELVQKLRALSGELHRFPGWESRCHVALRDADVVISHDEVNDKHGVGVLIRRLFLGATNILSIRSVDHYGGKQDFGDVALCLSHKNSPRDVVFASVLDALGHSTVRRVLCVPYSPDDARTAIAVKEIFGVRLCTYLMDDQNVCCDGIPDGLMRELLEKSALRLAISPELRVAYEHKYGLKTWYMPPVVPARLILSQLNAPPASVVFSRGAIIGNIWGRRWLQLLRNTVRHSGVTVTWYCNGGFGALPCSRDELAADSIFPHEPPCDDELVRVLRSTWFAVVPGGTLEGDDDRRFIAALSLPSRVIYMMATSQIPILVLGSRKTCAANFVEQFGIGVVSDYNRRSFVQAVRFITQPETNLAMRERALAVAGRFTDAGALEWIWQSLACGEPVDGRFEDLMPRQRPDLSHLVSRKGATCH